MRARHLFWSLFLWLAILNAFSPALGAGRGHLSVTQALIGNWSFNYKNWYGKEMISNTTHRFYPDGTYLVVTKDDIQKMQWSVLEKDEKDNWIKVYVTNPATRKGHQKLIEYSPDKLGAQETIYFSYYSIVRHKQKSTTMSSTWHYMGEIE